MRKTISLAVISLLMIAAIPVAHGQQEGVLVIGSLDCGMWVTARKQNRASNLEHYLIGLLNGMSLGRSVDFWGATGVTLSREQAYLWLDNYCAKNPLKGAIEGASDLMDEHTKSAYSKAAR